VLRLPDVILAQTESMRETYLRLGAPPGNVRAAGNLKYDFRPRQAEPGSPVRAYLEGLGGEVWIAASTMPPAATGDPDEDDAVLDAFQQLAAVMASPYL